MKQNTEQALRSIAGAERVWKNEDLKQHTTFRIGGPADYLVTPDGPEMVAELIRYCRRESVPYYVLGNGSNLLVGDQGYRGVVIQLFRNYNQIITEGTVIRAQAGAMLSSVSRQALEHELTGLEFASGIPGTIGGAMVMNAGAYGGEMKDVVREVTVLTPDGELLVIPADRMEFGYRTSIVEKNHYIVIETVLQLQQGCRAEILERMEQLRAQRISKQPLDMPSAGSTFKRPEGHFAGKLIMDAGLRGFSVGGARVSDKHCGFVVNTGDETASGGLELIRQVQDRVREQSGIELEPEVKMLGEF